MEVEGAGSLAQVVNANVRLFLRYSVLTHTDIWEMGVAAHADLHSAVEGDKRISGLAQVV